LGGFLVLLSLGVKELMKTTNPTFSHLPTAKKPSHKKHILCYNGYV
jgi:hypothetical protein